MNEQQIRARRLARERARRARARRARLIAVGALLVVALAATAIALAGTGGKTSDQHAQSPATTSGHQAGAARAARTGHGSSRSRTPHSTVTGVATGKPGTATVPVLMYHVINPPPAGAPYPGLYVPAEEFTAQMQALKAAGWHAVTMDQLEAYWTRGVPLGPGKPVVLTFDNGYASQYTHAMPVLKQLGWVGNENIQLSGLPPSQGGLTDAQVRGLLAAGWELDTQGISHADLIALDSSELHYQVDTARQILRRRYGVPVNWFCYPSGHYNATVIAAVKAAGYVGSTTVIPGWATPSEDPYRLPRLRVLGGTSPAALLEQIAQAQSSGTPPGSYGSTGTA
ncbi:MAG: polysaccharide deacetylase family protein [Solirubrobacterales bacterium]|nr:polysaccharide deacetylase family protein [Solirubrobacterales bacterium]MBV9941982.1 polysaccharide deacetylase family protein [Solirubrobacterales bacterium]